MAELWNRIPGPVRRGGAFASSLIGAVATGLSIFNLVVDVLGIPVSPMAEPIVRVYSLIVEEVISRLGALASWAVPKWNSNFTATIALMAVIVGRAIGISLLPSGTPVVRHIGAVVSSLLLLVLAVCIPLVRYVGTLYVLVTVPILMISGVIQLAKGKVYDDDLSNIMPNAGLYFLGCLVAGAVFLILNYYY
ncbi:MAG: hypothetical protein R3C13_14100 [Hyphomonas sp.]|uniref:hypothetical protein n=1 Tax=Hyphomonas sp. TaxID=87 RepID=UPI003528BA29